MGSRGGSSMLGSSLALRDKSVSVVACVLIVALGPIQFGFNLSVTVGLMLAYLLGLFVEWRILAVLAQIVCMGYPYRRRNKVTPREKKKNERGGDNESSERQPDLSLWKTSGVEDLLVR
ncbi:hypothetical protein V6N12_065215 [Hibiscus sabdariffa]|uniref:Uncharacterized protein n=1 Tax=Hibiscus sabdariffa TaxID=183260 RepID=A0ABR2G906_9ROSI